MCGINKGDISGCKIRGFSLLRSWNEVECFGRFCFKMSPKNSLLLRVQSCLFSFNLSDDKLPVSLVLPDCEGPVCWI